MTRAYLSSTVLYSVGRIVSRSPQFFGMRLGLIGSPTRIDEHTDHHRDLAAIDQVVHHVLRPDIPFRQPWLGRR